MALIQWDSISRNISGSHHKDSALRNITNIRIQKFSYVKELSMVWELALIITKRISRALLVWFQPRRDKHSNWKLSATGDQTSWTSLRTVLKTTDSAEHEDASHENRHHWSRSERFDLHKMLFGRRARASLLWEMLRHRGTLEIFPTFGRFERFGLWIYSH